ncbi:Helix-loop-helix DNA-binding domain protein [Ancylostoma duodenale]|uniref:Helix-loop-helix DNA-binding domain protein n=1 Tax=Ancylostoma duodenale TaxID=51022 RepID=A0A0C2DIG0_9BILA|nr:Helix-loop-helix DNA-binding domain protein [Ancylostoma duodenale]
MYSDIESFSSDERGHMKKTNKPMMEKKRRARINHCLSELKEILICDKHASAGHAKWEKADILEMTVDYLKKLRALRDHHSPHSATASAATATETTSSQPKDCDSTPTSTVPSPSSTESSSDGPTTTKRRRTTSPSPPTPQEPRSFLAPTPSTPLSLSTLPTSIRVPPVISPQMRPAAAGFNFMAQHLLALQYQQNLKMAAIAPGILPAVAPVHPFSAMTTIPWRTI